MASCHSSWIADGLLPPRVAAEVYQRLFMNEMRKQKKRVDMLGWVNKDPFHAKEDHQYHSRFTAREDHNGSPLHLLRKSLFKSVSAKLNGSRRGSDKSQPPNPSKAVSSLPSELDARIRFQ